jgi:hypothetical protein
VYVGTSENISGMFTTALHLAISIGFRKQMIFHPIPAVA